MRQAISGDTTSANTTHAESTPGAGKKGHISLDSVKRFNDEVYQEKVNFVREEAKRNGRSADAVKISSFIFITMLTESREATRKTAEQMAQAFGQTPESLLGSPMIMIGTPEDQGFSGFPVRHIQYANGKVTSTIELKEFHRETFPASNFELPAGFTKQSMGQRQ